MVRSLAFKVIQKQGRICFFWINSITSTFSYQNYCELTRAENWKSGKQSERLENPWYKQYWDLEPPFCFIKGQSAPCLLAERALCNVQCAYTGIFQKEKFSPNLLPVHCSLHVAILFYYLRTCLTTATAILFYYLRTCLVLNHSYCHLFLLF